MGVDRPGSGASQAEEAAEDPVGIRVRLELAEALSGAFRAGGQLLWVGGAMFGTDRAEGESPFKFGSDATVGVAAVLQIACELVRGATALFRDGNRYSAAALLRQLVEAEYLAWAFAKEEKDAETWMRSTNKERMKLFRPGQLRERSEGLFRHGDYQAHCGKGGHPSPEGFPLLPDHSEAEPQGVWWCDMNMHGLNIWDYALEAAGRHGHADALGPVGESSGLDEIRGRWRVEDPTIVILDWLNANRAEPGRPDDTAAA